MQRDFASLCLSFVLILSNLCVLRLSGHRRHMRQKHNMKQLPRELRPYEKCEEQGAAALSDTELLAVLLRTGSAQKNALELAEEILCLNSAGAQEGRGQTATAETHAGLLNLLRLEGAAFREVHGIGRIKAIELCCMAELSKRLWRATAARALDLHSAASVAAYYREELRHCDEEHVCLLLLDARDGFLRSIPVSMGSVRASSISPREIFRTALLHRAAGFILVHNHPSGNVLPSGEDKALIDILERMGRMMGVFLRDALIIGDGAPGYFSFMEHDMLHHP